jgi:hypothetical protein
MDRWLLCGVSVLCVENCCPLDEEVTVRGERPAATSYLLVLLFSQRFEGVKILSGFSVHMVLTPDTPYSGNGT